MGLGAIAPEARGQGLGRALVDRCLAWFAERGCTRVGVVTQGSALTAQRLYESVGFRVTAIELWHHRWFDSTERGPA
jgi:ribosomal protein S18 acetylase RimI-like enzyme